MKAALFALAMAVQPSAWDGVYTDAQAARGGAHYDQNCARCHGAQLLGTYDTPSLRGRLVARWSGTTLDGLSGYINSAMPIHAPGALKPQANADMLAYILKANGYPAGARELPTAPDALKAIRFTAGK